MANDFPDVLYHYCPMPAFYSITNSRSIWLSSLLQTNDFLEGKYHTNALRRVAERDGVSPEQLEGLVEALSSIEGMEAGLALCLSSEPDVLSQWRGYASDASGVSIGFSTAYLLKLGAIKLHGDSESFTIRQIEYSQSKLDAYVLDAYKSTKELISLGALNRPFGFPREGAPEVSEEEAAAQSDAHKKLWNRLASPIMDQIYCFKGHAFSEEKEWRLLTKTGSVLFDGCDFRMNGDRLIPFREYPLVAFEECQPILDIVIGPKNRTSRHVIGAYLRSRGYKDFKLRFSEASYR